MAKKTLNLELRGLTCDGCAATVRRYLEQVDGVEEAVIDWEGGRGEVVFDPARTDEEKILNSRAFRRQYSASAIADGGEGAEPRCC